MWSRTLLLALSAACATNAAATSIPRGSLQPVSDFGPNTSGTQMNIYVPNNLASSKPPIVVALHTCATNATFYYENTPYYQLAEKNGFIVIYPNSPYEGSCWDVSSDAALMHNGGADTSSIANMVEWTIKQFDADKARVYVTGSSSGAMMTNVLAATYPNLFAAASVYSGVAAGCFYTGTVDGWNSTCSTGQLIQTQEAWKETALKMDPGYKGCRPKMLIFHGNLDTALLPPNFNETLKQWSGVFGLPFEPISKVDNTPLNNYTTYNYGPKLKGIFAWNAGHTVPINPEVEMAWFGFKST